MFTMTLVVPQHEKIVTPYYHNKKPTFKTSLSKDNDLKLLTYSKPLL